MKPKAQKQTQTSVFVIAFKIIKMETTNLSIKSTRASRLKTPLAITLQNSIFKLFLNRIESLFLTE